MSEKPTYEALEHSVKVLKQEIKKNEQTIAAQRKNRNQLEAVLANIQCITYRCALDKNWAMRYMSPHADKLTGYPPEDFINNAIRSYESIIHRNDTESVTNSILEAIKSGKPWEIEYRLCHKNGSILWVYEKGHCAMGTDDGNVKHLFGFIINITKRKQIEAALRESEEKFRAMFEQAAVGVALCNSRTGAYIKVNQRYCDIAGYTLEEIRQLSFHEITHPDDIGKDLDQMKLLLEGKTREFTIKKRFCRKNGAVVWVKITVSPMWKKGEAPNAHVAIVEDITNSEQAKKALKESEDKLARSKKMETLGLLAGGVAHDLNNVLSGIVSYPELLLMDLPEDSEFRKPLETIQAAGQRAAAIVEDLLTVARGAASAKEPLNLNAVIDDYVNSPEFKKLAQFHLAVTVKKRLESNLFNVNGSYAHIRKVLMNLVSNAAEAIKGSGTVTLATTNRYLDRPLKGFEIIDRGEYVILSVSDEGAGISSGDLARIFEPFYTKKTMGRSGTGLGLAVVWNVVRDHNGYIHVATGEKGTVFEVYFPITRVDITDQALIIPIENYKGNKETILVVDDVKSQREISRAMLERLGYTPLTVASGEEAVAYMKNNTTDLVLLDMIMDPGINGRETYERIIKIHPGQKAVIVSGFAETDEVKKTQTAGAGRYIKKPITIEKLGLAIKEELKGASF